MIFVALSAEQMATVEDAVADPFAVDLFRMVERYAAGLGARYSRINVLFASALIGAEGMRELSERDRFRLDKLGPIIDETLVPFDERPRANPRAPIPDAIRRAGRQRWQ